MKLKKIFYYATLTILTVGASLMLGLLSFGGMFSVFPALLPAFAAFGLAVAYEGEIYLQNIKGALQKLSFKFDYAKQSLAIKFLAAQFEKNVPNNLFFQDYQRLIHEAAALNSSYLPKAQQEAKKRINKKLKDMEFLFASLFFKVPPARRCLRVSEYKDSLAEWLEFVAPPQEELQRQLVTTNKYLRAAKIFSFVASLFMSFGATYLLVEAFEIIPFLFFIPNVLMPVIILPLSLVAGIAYGLLTYNAVVDLINNDTLHHWKNKIINDFQEGITVKKLITAAIGVFLVSLAGLLTICTAGTWWTLMQNTTPLFNWMRRIPSVITLLTPIVTGLSALIFNLQNTNASLEMLEDAQKQHKNLSVDHENFSLREMLKQMLHNENWGQFLNPFRLLLKLTVTPLRVILFLGHLVSIGVTADRMPGVNQVVAALLGIVSEGFEDLHYFLIKEEPDQLNNTKELVLERLEPNFDGDTDLPTKTIKFIFSPIYVLATLWDWATSKFNDSAKKTLTLSEAWYKQQGHNLGKFEHAGANSSKFASDLSKNYEKNLISFGNKNSEEDSINANFSAASDKILRASAYTKEQQRNNAPDFDVRPSINEQPQASFSLTKGLFSRVESNRIYKSCLQPLNSNGMNNEPEEIKDVSLKVENNSPVKLSSLSSFSMFDKQLGENFKTAFDGSPNLN